jgi:hypothetical protein
MGRLIEFRIPRSYLRKPGIFQPGHKAKILKFKAPSRKFLPDDWHILGLAVSDLIHMDSPHLR